MCRRIVAIVSDVIMEAAMEAWLVNPVGSLDIASRKADIRLIEA
jgi:hypothetical protein